MSRCFLDNKNLPSDHLVTVPISSVLVLKPSEARRFAKQVERNQIQIKQLRDRARDAVEQDDGETAKLCRVAANAIQQTATEWATLASKMAKQ